MISIILIIVIVLLGYPIGLLIAKLTKEELKAGRKWFRILVFVSAIAIVASILFTTGETLLFLVMSFVFILLLALASWIQSNKLNHKKKLKKKK